MRKLVLAAIFGAAAAALSAPGNAHADPYKWCAVLNMGDAAYNCGFVTVEQCRATVSGIGGFCERNPFYSEPGRKPEKSQRPRRQY
ncbi:MAG: DUF3551 domain-containing protein [Rhizobiales bacterium]|nr:DUF3551 domain-containing protein [Hyphomicrobiales bacterium]